MAEIYVNREAYTWSHAMFLPYYTRTTCRTEL